jgi:opacity protein-like surface antigen
MLHHHGGGRLLLLAAALAIAALAAPARAHAQLDPRDPRTGLEGSVHFGAGGFSNRGAFRHPGETGRGSFDPSLGIHLALGYRFVPVLSAGVRGLYQFLAFEVPRGTDGSAVAWAVGGYVRLHLLGFAPPRRGDLVSRADLHLGVGLDYAGGHAGTRTATPVGTFSTDGSASGVAVPVTLGLDVAVHENVLAGVLLQWSYWSVGEKCGQALGLTGCDRGPFEAESYLYAGLGVRGHYNLTR